MRTAYLTPLTLLCAGISAAPLDIDSASALTPRDTPSCSGPGILLTNKSSKQQDYVFYNNFWNGVGTAGANFDHPDKTVSLAPGASQFVSLATTFKGRVQRGTALPSTWAEFQVQASDDGGAHGDISLEQGYDGPATIASTDTSIPIVSGGFTNDAFNGAPQAAFQNKPDGTKALASTMGNWLGGPNQAAITHLNKVVGQSKAYITGGTGVPDIASKNRCLAITFY